MKWLDFFFRWWGPIVLFIFEIFVYFDWLPLPQKFPHMILRVGLIVVWALTKFVKAKIEKPMSLSDSFSKGRTEMKDLMISLSKEYPIQPLEITRIKDPDIHATKKGVFYKILYMEDGVQKEAKIDPHDRENPLIQISKLVNVRPGLSESDINIEKIERQRQLLEKKYESGKFKGRRKIKTEAEYIPEVVDESSLVR